MDRNSVIKLMRGYGAFFAARPGDRPYHANYEKLASVYGETPNLGMVLGEESNGLVAVTLHHHASPRAADLFLPQTGLIFGTLSRPRSHRIYRCEGELCSNRTFGHGKSPSVELRGEGRYLLLPSSEPVSGETLEYFETGSPGEISREELRKAVTLLYEFCDCGREYSGRLGEYRRVLTARTWDFSKDEIDRYLSTCEQYFADDDPYWRSASNGNAEELEGMEIREWLAIRREEALKIDPENVEMCRHYRYNGDPYFVDPNCPEEWCYLDKAYFVSTHGSEMWVWDGDLPEETRKRIWNRPLKPVSSPAVTDLEIPF